jgi:hypothetical protein
MEWKTHTEQIIPNMSNACNVIRFTFLFNNIDTFKIIYISYFQIIMKYGITFRGSPADSTSVFQLQKKAVRTMAGTKSRISC